MTIVFANAKEVSNACALWVPIFMIVLMSFHFLLRQNTQSTLISGSRTGLKLLSLTTGASGKVIGFIICNSSHKPSSMFAFVFII